MATNYCFPRSLGYTADKSRVEIVRDLIFSTREDFIRTYTPFIFKTENRFIKQMKVHNINRILPMDIKTRKLLFDIVLEQDIKPEFAAMLIVIVRKSIKCEYRELFEAMC